MTKSYSPAYVRNPSSMQHLVYLHPGQHLVLTLDRNEDDRKSVVELSGNMLEVEGSMREGNQDWFFIKAKNFTAPWSQYSSTFIGEIWIEVQETLSRLIVVQGCTNKVKSNHYTVVNPDCWDIRIRPHNVLEVVLYDIDFTYQDEWHWNWKPVFNDLELEMLGKDVLSLYYVQKKEGDDPNYQYAMCPRMDTEVSATKLCRQHHFWFRFNKGIVNMSRDHSEVLRVGDIDFRGKASKFLPNSRRLTLQAAVYIDFRKAKIGRVLDTLALKKKEDEPRGTRNYATSTNLPATTNRKSKWSSYKPKKVLPTIKQVAIKRIESEEIDEGCKVLAAQPSATQMVAYDEYDIMKHFDEYPNCHGVPHWKYWD